MSQADPVAARAAAPAAATPPAATPPAATLAATTAPAAVPGPTSDAAPAPPAPSRDDPEAYIPRDRRRALAAGSAMPDRVRGAGLFADISGFTPLTEALANELGPQRGAEELTVNIGRVFHEVIGELDQFGGDVIYFSGDAITCWIDGDDGTRACAAALAMQDAMERSGTIRTPGGTVVQLAIKVAVAVGEARRFLVGDPEIQLIDVLAGSLIDDLAAAEHFAGKGEVVLEPSAVTSLGDRVSLHELREDHGENASGRTYGVLEALRVKVERAPVVEPPRLPEDVVRSWLLPAVYGRLRTGRGEFLTELRPAYPVFVRFSGIDYDDDEAVHKLDEFVRGAQRILAGYGGNLLQLTLGDKGAYLYGVFGSPVAHEDDAARAAAAVLELRDLERTTAAREIQVGVTHGRLRSGTYGHAMRRTFVCLGDAVNLSARLMSAAPPGRIYVSDVVHDAAGDAFIWERLPDLKVKGKVAPVVAYSLTGSLQRASRRKLRFELRLVGRKRELATLEARLGDALGRHGQVLGIAAEAGMGKSRLVAEFVRDARRRGLFVAFGECQAFGTTTSYFPWREIWRRFFRLEDDDPDADQLARLEAELRAIDPTLVPRAPLLEAVLGLNIPDTDLTRSFDPKLRKASLEDLLATCLRARTAHEPIVIVIEDCHWIDELSRDLLDVLARGSADARVLFVLAYRPATTPLGGLGLERLSYASEIALDELDAADAREVVRSKLQQVAGRGTAPSDELVELVIDRADGNPLYIEELVSFIAGRGIDIHDRAAMAALQLPESLHSLVLSRIDSVSEEPRRTLKVASVVGRLFRAPVLPGAYEELGSLEAVREHLETLGAADLVGLDREEDLSYLFKHVTTQEVAYESMPFAMRAMLHRRVGAYIERAEAGNIDQHLDLLAHHYWLSDDEEKKRFYLAAAGELAQADYANTAAVDYYERLIPLLAGPERIDATLKLASVLQLVGNLARAETLALEVRSIAADRGDVAREAWCDASLAETLRRQSRYDEATARLDAAIARFRELGEEAGLAEMLHVLGTVAAQRGDYAMARTRWLESREVRERIGDRSGVAKIDGNLAVLAEYGGDYRAAQEINERALTLLREIGDRRGMSGSELNAGMYALFLGEFDEARARLEVAIRLCLEIGNRMDLALARNNLANAYRGLGDRAAAAEQYVAALTADRELDFRWALSFLLEDIGVFVAQLSGGPAGFEFLGAAETLRAEIGSPRPAALEGELAGHLTGAREALGEEQAEAAIARGRGWTTDEAIDAALTLLAQLTATAEVQGPNGAMTHR